LLEEIPSEKIKTEFWFRDGATALGLPWLQAPVFTDLAVRWTDLEQISLWLNRGDSQEFINERVYPH
jgi:hypothetical protein